MEPGEYLLRDEPVNINSGRRTLKVAVRNTGDRAVQVGSHYHFFEVNRALEFDRTAAMGMRLNILSGTTLRFEPGDTREVELVEFAGWKRAVGFNGLVDGSTMGHSNISLAVERALRLGYQGTKPPQRRGGG